MPTLPRLKIFVGFLSLAIILYGWMWFVRQNFPPLYTPHSNPDIYMAVPAETNPFLEPWQRWDTLHYQAIASRGYAAFDTALFTPPLYPWLIGLTAPMLHGNTLATGLLISTVFAFLTLLVFNQVAQDVITDKEVSTRATVYFILYPGAFFLFAVYTESIFLFFAMLALRFADQGKFWQAGVMGGLASLTRSPGILVIVPLTFAAWQAYKIHRAKKGLWTIVLMLVISLIYPLTAWITIGATPLNILMAIGRGGHITIPGFNLLAAIQHIFGGVMVIENTLESAFTVIFGLLSILALKRLPKIYGIYSLTMMIFLLSRMGSPQPLVGMIRYVYTIFPAFFVLAEFGENPIAHRIILYVSWLGLLLFAGQFAIWGWIG